MKKFKLLIVACMCAISVFCTVCCNSQSGMENIGEQGVTPQIENNIVSYLSTDSSVYSSTADLVDAVADTVVEISTESVTTQWGQQYIVSGAGSGVIVGSNESTYYIVTNNHVIEGANEIMVTTRFGLSYNATLEATDDSEDIAVITVKSEGKLSVAVWGNSDDLRIGEDLIAIGNPLGSLGGTVTKGILSAKGRSITVGNYVMTLLQTDTAINPGNSGGGLFNMKGELIGIVNAKTSDEEIEGICFAIPANTARAVYDDLVCNGYVVGRAAFGIEVVQTTVSSGGINAQTQYIVYITSVKNDNDGFRQYDRINKINGKTITTILDYNIALSALSPGDVVEAEVYRGSVTPSWYGNNITFETEVTSFTVTVIQYGM